MRFLMLNWRDPKNPKAGGAERVTEGYWRALLARGHEVHWFANAFPDAPAEETLDGLHVARGGGPGTSIVAAWRWYRRQPRFDLVVDQNHGLPWFAPWWCRTRCVAYIHEVLGPIWHSFYRGLTPYFGAWQERNVLRLYRNVPFWTACQSTERMLREFGVRHIQRIPYGVHTRALPALEPKPLTRPLRLIVVSRLAPNKRIGHALRVCRLALDRGLDTRLTVVGGGDDEARLHALAAELRLGDAVRFTGALPEPEKDALLRAAHLLLHTSLREGWGLNVIEANAMGTPSVVYPAPGLTESTLHDQTGVVCEEETPESMVEALAALAADEPRYQRSREAAWRRADTFHWDKVLPRACDWLEQMAQARP
jgi:glycosyltransferase involved in cell wall biosynthesis